MSDEEKKAISFKIEGDKFIIEIDPNKDGDKLMKFELNMLEVPDEIISLIKK